MQRPRLLSDNGASYVASDPADWLEDKGMHHAGSTVYHPQTQGKIERWHQTLKNHIPLENYYLPGDLAQRIGAFVEHYNHARYRESIENLTPADVHFGKPDGIDCSPAGRSPKKTGVPIDFNLDLPRSPSDSDTVKGINHREIL